MKLKLLVFFLFISIGLFSQSIYKTQAYCNSYKVPYLDSTWTEWTKWEPIELKIYVGNRKIRIYEKISLVKSISDNPYKVIKKYFINQTYFITDELDNFHLFIIALDIDEEKLVGMKLYYLVESQTYQLYIRSETVTICYEMVKLEN